MRLLCRQENDGQAGDVFEIDTYGTPAAEYLERKAASHGEKGWTVTRTPQGVHAFKVLPAVDRRRDPGSPRRKDRRFWLEA